MIVYQLIRQYAACDKEKSASECSTLAATNQTQMFLIEFLQRARTQPRIASRIETNIETLRYHPCMIVDDDFVVVLCVEYLSLKKGQLIIFDSRRIEIIVAL